jgi:hypothetical protein
MSTVVFFFLKRAPNPVSSRAQSLGGPLKTSTGSRPYQEPLSPPLMGGGVTLGPASLGREPEVPVAIRVDGRQQAARREAGSVPVTAWPVKSLRAERKKSMGVLAQL